MKAASIYIPIYRAKVLTKNDQNEFGIYVEGDYISILKSICKAWGNKSAYIKVDESTLAIHHKGMIDSEGNKIFASLSEDRKGGDMMKWIHASEESVSYEQAYMECGRVSIDNQTTGSKELEMKNTK